MVTTYPVYPQYDIGAKWIEPIPADKLNDPFYIHPCRQVEGQMGYFWNSTSFSRMYRTDPTEEGVRKNINEWWEKYRVEKNIAIETCEMQITRQSDEEWCITWFSHYTFDTGQTDQEVLDSFWDFLMRKGVRIGMGEYGTYDPNAYCAMGAEDRWRWCGSSDGSHDGDRTDPPCRCKHCKDQGVIRIGH